MKLRRVNTFYKVVDMAWTPRLLFRIFYISFFTILNIVLLGLFIVTPADAIQQALNNNQLYNVFVIAGCYLLTVAFTLMIYASRLYTNRSVLAAIPKTWIPVEKGDVNNKVRRMIAASLTRSAVIAYDSRPRIKPEPSDVEPEPEARDAAARAAPEKKKRKSGLLHKRRSQVESDEQNISIPSHHPVWGEIAHNGWSSPTSPDLPNLQYITVILELPHLIEARAVSLAPPDPMSTTKPPMPDTRALGVLQRPTSMGLREFISHLTSIGVITSPIATEFLAAYEYARFSGRPLSEPEFRKLMKQFADLLRSMNALSASVLENLDIYPPESDIDDDGSFSSTPTTQRSRSLVSSRSCTSGSGSEGIIRTAPSRRVVTNGTSTNDRIFSTAPATPATPKSRQRIISRSPSINSFARSRRPYNTSNGNSSTSLRSTSSVIKLSRTNVDGELPNILTISETR